LVLLKSEHGCYQNSSDALEKRGKCALCTKMKDNLGSLNSS